MPAPPGKGTVMIQIHNIARLTGHEASVFALSPFLDERYFLSAGGDGWIVQWDLAEPELGKLVAKVDVQIFSLCYHEAHRRIIAGNMNGGLHWIDIKQPDQTRNIAHHQKGVFALLPYGDHLFSAGGLGKLTRWSVPETRTLESLQLSNQSLRCLALHPQQNLLAVGASDNNIYLLDPSTLTVQHRLDQAHENSVFAVRFSSDGRFLFSGGRDAQLRVWDVSDRFREVSAQAAHWFTINDIAFHPDGKWLATASRDKTIKIWDAHTFELLKVIETVRDKGHINSVNRLYWSSYQNYLLSASDDRTIGVWDTALI